MTVTVSPWTPLWSTPSSVTRHWRPHHLHPASLWWPACVSDPPSTLPSRMIFLKYKFESLKKMFCLLLTELIEIPGTALNTRMCSGSPHDTTETRVLVPIL